MLACLAGQAVVSVEENHHPLPLLRLPGFDAGVVAGPLAAEVGEQPQQVRETEEQQVLPEHPEKRERQQPALREQQPVRHRPQLAELVRSPARHQVECSSDPLA